MDQAVSHGGTSTTQQAANIAKKPRRPYQKPQLVSFGDIREITLRMNPEIVDGQNPVIFRPE